MNLGLGLSLGSNASGVSAPVSLFDTSDLFASGATDHQAVIDENSFRYARSGAGDGRFSLGSLPATIRITGVFSAWDGAPLGTLGSQLRIINPVTFATIYTNAVPGAFDTGPLASSSAGTIQFAAALNNGVRVDDFFIEAA